MNNASHQHQRRRQCGRLVVLGWTRSSGGRWADWRGSSRRWRAAARWPRCPRHASRPTDNSARSRDRRRGTCAARAAIGSPCPCARIASAKRFSPLTSAKRVMPTQNAPCCQLRGLRGFLGVARDTVRGAHARELPVGDARGELEHVLASGAFRSCDDGDGKQDKRRKAQQTTPANIVHRFPPDWMRR